MRNFFLVDRFWNNTAENRWFGAVLEGVALLPAAAAALALRALTGGSALGLLVEEASGDEGDSTGIQPLGHSCSELK
jgi:hypothetical protein